MKKILFVVRFCLLLVVPLEVCGSKLAEKFPALDFYIDIVAATSLRELLGLQQRFLDLRLDEVDQSRLAWLFLESHGKERLTWTDPDVCVDGFDVELMVGRNYFCLKRFMGFNVKSISAQTSDAQIRQIRLEVYAEMKQRSDCARDRKIKELRGSLQCLPLPERVRLAGDQGTDVEVLSALGEDQHREVRLNLARNHRTPLSVVCSLKEESDEEIRLCARNNALFARTIDRPRPSLKWRKTRISMLGQWIVNITTPNKLASMVSAIKISFDRDMIEELLELSADDHRILPTENGWELNTLAKRVQWLKSTIDGMTDTPPLTVIQPQTKP